MVTVPCIDSAENKCRQESCLCYCNHIQVIYANTQSESFVQRERQTDRRIERQTIIGAIDTFVLYKVYFSYFQNQNSNVQLVQCTDQMKIKCPLHIMYFTFVNPQTRQVYSPSTVQANTDLHTVRQKDLKAMKKSFYIQDPASVQQCFFIASPCLILQFFSSIIYTDFFICGQFPCFSAKTVKRLQCECLKTTACLVDKYTFVQT